MAAPEIGQKFIGGGNYFLTKTAFRSRIPGFKKLYTRIDMTMTRSDEGG